MSPVTNYQKNTFMGVLNETPVIGSLFLHTRRNDSGELMGIELQFGLSLLDIAEEIKNDKRLAVYHENNAKNSVLFVLHESESFSAKDGLVSMSFVTTLKDFSLETFAQDKSLDIPTGTIIFNKVYPSK